MCRAHGAGILLVERLVVRLGELGAADRAVVVERPSLVRYRKRHGSHASSVLDARPSDRRSPFRADARGIRRYGDQRNGYHSTPSRRESRAVVRHLLRSMSPVPPEITSRSERLHAVASLRDRTRARRTPCRESEEPPDEPRSARRSMIGRARRPRRPPFACATSRDVRRSCRGTTTRRPAGCTHDRRSSHGPRAATAPERRSIVGEERRGQGAVGPTGRRGRSAGRPDAGPAHADGVPRLRLHAHPALLARRPGGTREHAVPDLRTSVPGQDAPTVGTSAPGPPRTW